MSENKINNKFFTEDNRRTQWTESVAPVPRTWLETQLPSVLELVLFLLLFSEAAVIDYLLLDYMYGNDDDYHKHWYMDDEWGLESQVFFFYYQRRVRDTFASGCKLIGTFLYFLLCFY